MCYPRHLSIYPYALAKLGYTPPKPWLDALWEITRPRLGEYTAQNLANTIWAFGKFRWGLGLLVIRDKYGLVNLLVQASLVPDTTSSKAQK